MMKKYPERGRIDVIVRKRPLNELEISRGDKDIVICNNDVGIIREYKCKIDGTCFIEEHEFKVDRFYDETADNELIYREYVKPLVECAFRENMTCSCFTYGQTGSGKTFTMIGSRITNSKVIGTDPKVVAGIYEYAANDIYKILKEPEFRNRIEVVISFFEIYSGKLYDLLQNRNPLESLDNGRNEVVIRDLCSKTVKSKDELVELMLSGLNLRKIGQNSQNDRSSRSHALLRIELKIKENNKLHGSLVFIDLAGSERGADSVGIYYSSDAGRASKQSFERSGTNKALFGEGILSKTSFEGTCINKSLLALKECIRAMESEKLHVPFRDSELTKVLRDIFVRESKNLMIANLSPSNRYFDQTINTMRYASKVKSFKVNSTTTTNISNGGSSSTSSGSSISSSIISGSSASFINSTSTTSGNSGYNNSSKNNNSGINTSSTTTNRGNNTTPGTIGKFNSLQPGKWNSKYQEFYKSPLSCRFVRESKRSTPTLSNSPSDFYINDKMDLDQSVSNDSDNTLDINTAVSTTVGSGSGNDRGNVILQSQLDRVLKESLNKSMCDITSILDNIELSETNDKIYNYVSSTLSSRFSSNSRIDSGNKDWNGKMNAIKGPVDDKSEDRDGPYDRGDDDGNKAVKEGSECDTDVDAAVDDNTGADQLGEIVDTYNLYNKISTILRCVDADDVIHHISNVLRIELKLILHLNQLIDTYFNQ